MDQTPASTPAVNVLHCALELSKNTWLLGIQFPDRPRPSLYPIDGGDTDKLMAKLIEARDRWAKVSGEAPAITVCYEVGYDDSGSPDTSMCAASIAWWSTQPACRSTGVHGERKPIGSMWLCCCVR